MAAKKTTATGPKAQLMKKSMAQLKAQAKKLKIKGFSTKKKDQLVSSIMMAQARMKKGSTPKRTMAQKPGVKRMAKKRGAAANKVMRTPVRSAIMVKPKVKMRKPMMGSYNGWTNYETWLVNLHFDQLFRELAEEFFADVTADLNTSIYDLAEQFSEVVNEMTFEFIQGDNSYFLDDMANAFLAQVNYREIAEMVSEDFM